MNILEIYNKYRIMPQLQEHQFRVAAVANILLDNLSPLPSPLALCGEGRVVADRENIIKACLLHDMGNIVKFNLGNFKKVHPGMAFTSEDETFWGKIKLEFEKKYGTDSHDATIKIIEEINVGERVTELVDCIGFGQGKTNAAKSDFGKKICAYADMRVKPNGVSSLEERLLDLRKRYNHKHRLMGGKKDLRLEFENGLREIEKQIFAYCKKKPEDITEESIEEKLGKLRNFEI